MVGCPHDVKGQSIYTDVSIVSGAKLSDGLRVGLVGLNSPINARAFQRNRDLDGVQW